MHYDFCTLFDRDYLFKGLALLESLERSIQGAFTLYVLCMDDTVYDVMRSMRLPQVQLIALADFEDEELLTAKATRSRAEYCWTCTPSLPLYLLDRVPGITAVTYLDADLWFFDDPAPIFAEMGGGSVGIIEHRYSSEFESLTKDYGIYNVEYVVFRNDERARACLVWWRERCNEWCYDRVEDGRFGDQKYLDDWPERFEGVVVLRTTGAGLAPWNLRSHSFTEARGRLSVDGQPMIFFHYHSFTIGRDGRRYRPCHAAYGVKRRRYRLLYRPYWSSLKRAMGRTRQVEPGYAYGISSQSLDPLSTRLVPWARWARSRAGLCIRQIRRAALSKWGSLRISETVVPSAAMPKTPVDDVESQGADSCDGVAERREAD